LAPGSKQWHPASFVDRAVPRDIDDNDHTTSEVMRLHDLGSMGRNLGLVSAMLAYFDSDDT